MVTEKGWGVRVGSGVKQAKNNGETTCQRLACLLLPACLCPIAPLLTVCRWVCVVEGTDYYKAVACWPAVLTTTNRIDQAATCSYSQAFVFRYPARAFALPCSVMVIVYWLVML